MYKLSDEAFNSYKSTVKGRENVSFETATILLNRNLILGEWFVHKNHSHIYYGKLRMTIKGDTIMYIKNNTNHNAGINKSKKLLLNEIMGMEDI